METVELLVRIPKDLYEGIECRNGELETEYVCDELMKAVDNGTVLPKGHGDLVDRDRLINRCLFMSNDDTAIEGMEYITKGMIKTAPTVIEADKEVKNE